MPTHVRLPRGNQATHRTGNASPVQQLLEEGLSNAAAVIECATALDTTFHTRPPSMHGGGSDPRCKNKRFPIRRGPPNQEPRGHRRALDATAGPTAMNESKLSRWAALTVGALGSLRWTTERPGRPQRAVKPGARSAQKPKIDSEVS